MSINWKRYTLGALLLAAFALLLFGCSGGGGSSVSGATKSISGVVSDPATGLPVANAQVSAFAIDGNGAESSSALSTPGSATSDAGGHYTLQIPASYSGSVMVEAQIPASSLLRQLRQLVTASAPRTLKSALPQTDVAQATIPPVMVSLATDSAVEFVRQTYGGTSFSSDNIRRANGVLEAIFGANFTQTPPPASATDSNTSKAQQDLLVSIAALNLVTSSDSSKTLASIVASLSADTGMGSVADALKNGIAQATAALSAAGTLPPEYQPSAAINTAISNAQAAPVALPDVSDSTPPSAPQNLAASAAPRKVTLTWSASTDDTGVVGYAICRADASGVYAAIDTVNAAGSSATSFSYNDLTVAAATSYSYKVLAFDKARNRSLPSAAATVTTPAATDAIAPAKPAGLVCKGFTSAQVNLQWPQAAKTNADGTTTPAASYNVYRDYQLVATVTETSFVDKTVQAGTVYTYYVKAADANGNLSTASQLLTVKTAPSSTATPPEAPSALALKSAASYSTVQLSWSGSATAGVSYNVYRDAQLIATGITGLAYSDGSVLPNSSYLYSVTAVAASAESVPAAALAVTTPANPNATDTAAPTMPTNLVALSATANSVSLTWSPSFKLSGDPTVAGYLILRGDATAKNFVKVGVVKTPGFTDSSVAPATTYSYQVRAFSSSGALSAGSAIWMVITPGAVDVTDTTAPTAPADLALAAAATSGSVPLKWSAATKSTGDLVVAGYLVYRNGAQIADVKGATSFTDNSVAGGVSYRYTVKAYDNPGNISAASSELAVTTPAAVPGTYNIYGSVVVNGAGLPGVTVTMTSGAGGTVTTVTDGNGNYSFTGVADNTRYSITAASTGYYSFTPATNSFYLSGSSVSGQIFSATLQGAINGGFNYPDGVIIGGVTYPSGTVIGGVVYPGGTIIGGVLYPTGTVIGGVSYPSGSIVGGIVFSSGAVSGSVSYPTGVIGGVAVYPTGSITGTLSW